MKIFSIEVTVVILPVDLIIILNFLDTIKAKFFVEADCSNIVYNYMEVDGPASFVNFHCRNDSLHKR